MLDEKSRKLLLELDYNARDSISKIGKKLRLSKDASINRLKKLEEEGYVKGYYTVVNYNKIGYSTYRLYIKLNDVSKKLEDKIESTLKNFKSVRFISYLSGEFDLIITFQVKSLSELEEACNLFFEEFSSKIVRKELAAITSQKHFMQPILKDKEKNKGFVTSINEEKSELSEVEFEILKLIALNSRMSFVQLSNKVGKKPNTLLYSLKGLEKKGVVIGYRPRLDFNKLGLSHYIVRIKLNNNSKKFRKDFEKNISTLNGIIYLSSGVTSYDYEVEFVLENTQKLREVLSRISEFFPGEVSSLSSELILSTKSLNYCPF